MFFYILIIILCTLIFCLLNGLISIFNNRFENKFVYFVFSEEVLTTLFKKEKLSTKLYKKIKFWALIESLITIAISFIFILIFKEDSLITLRYILIITLSLTKFTINKLVLNIIRQN